MRLLHVCGMPKEDVDFVNCSGPLMEQLLLQGSPRTTLFTGSSKVANRLAVALKGKVRLEGGGFDWKILGPDVPDAQYTVDYVSHVIDQDAHACSGQKCSAQSMLFVHKNWATGSDLYERMRELASRRSLDDLTVGPTLTVTTERLKRHLAALLEIPGAELLYGGEEIARGDHTIPKCYGAFVPTALKIPLREIVANDDTFHHVTTEVFAPFQVVTEYDDASLGATAGGVAFAAEEVLAVGGFEPEVKLVVFGAAIELKLRLTDVLVGDVVAAAIGVARASDESKASKG